jgi:hypothetical protein
MQDPDSIVELWWPLDHAEAHAIKQALDNSGIPCHIEGENVASWSGASAFGNTGRWQMRLLTLKKFHDQARNYIEDNDWPSYTP